MKKIVLFLWVILFSFAMAACEGDLTLPDGLTTNEDLTLPTGVTLPDNTTENPTGVELTTEDGVTTVADMTTENNQTEVPTSNEMTTESPKTVVPTTESPTVEVTEEDTVTTTTEVTTSDPDVEISAMVSMVNSTEMNILDTEAFVTELYNSGMRSADLINMMTNLSSIASITPTMSMVESYAIIDTMMENMDRSSVEALVSALVKVQLKDMLQSQLDMMGATPLSYSDTMTEYNGNYMIIEKYIQMIEENGDAVVESAMIGLNYLMDVQSVFDPTYIVGLEGLMGKTSYNTMDYMLMVSIKNGVLGYMKDELPTTSEFVILNSTVIAFLSILMDDTIDFSLLNVQAQATQQHMSLELMFDFFISIDTEYIQSLMDVSVDDVDSMYVKEFLYENIDLINDFMTDYAVELNALQNVLTYEDRENLFFDFYIDEVVAYILFDGYTESMEATAILEMLHEVIHYESLDMMPGMMSGLMSDLLSEIVASDYAVIDKVVDLAEMDPESYDSYKAYIDAENLAGIDMIFAVIDLLEPVLEGLEAEEYQAVLDLAVTVLTVLTENEIDMSLIDLELVSEQDMMAVNLFFDFLTSRNEAFETALSDLVLNGDDPYYTLAFVKESLKLIDGFFIENEASIVDLMSLSSVEERSDFFHNFIIDEVLVYLLNMNGTDEAMILDLVASIHENINFEAIEHLPMILGQGYVDMIHQLVESDFEVLDNLFDLMMLYPEDFTSIDDYDMQAQMMMVDLVLSVVDLVGPVVQNLSVEDYQSVLDTLVSGLSLMLDLGMVEGDIDFSLMEIELMSETEMRAINLFFDFLMLRDDDYEMALDAMILNPEDSEVIRAFLVENIELIDEFLMVYEMDINALNNVSTLEERSDFFHDFLIDEVLVFILDNQALSPSERDELVNMLHETINYEAIDALPGLLTGVVASMIHELVLSDYDVIDKFIYSVSISSLDYLDYNDYMVAVESANMAVVLSMLDLIVPVVQQVSVEEYQAVMDIAVMVVSLASEGELTLSALDTGLVSEANKMMVDLFLELLVSRDAEYDMALYALISEPDDPMLIKAFIIENISLIDQFFEDKVTEVDAIFALSTQAEREAFIKDFIIGEVLSFVMIQEGADDTMVNEVIAYLQTNLDWVMIEAMALTLDDVINDFIDALVASDFEVLDHLFDIMMMDPADYMNEDDYYNDKDLADLYFVLSIFDLINPVVQDLSLGEYQALLDASFMIIDLVVGGQEITMGSELTVDLEVISMLEAAFDNSAINQLHMIQEVVSYAATTSLIEEFYLTMTSEVIPNEQRDNMLAIIVSTVIDDLYNLVSVDYGVISSEITTLLEDTMFLEATDLDPVDVGYVIDFLSIDIPEIVVLAEDIREYDYNNLTMEEVQTIAELLDLLGVEQNPMY